MAMEQPQARLEDFTEDTTCPTCYRSGFENQRGMRDHHAKVHGESITKTQRECKGCGEMFSVRKSRVESGMGKYCTQACQHNERTRQRNVQRKCKGCGERFTVNKSRVESGMGKYCSRSCYNNSHNIELKCDECGQAFTTPKSRVVDGNRKYCSTSCHYEARTGRTTVERECDECGQVFNVEEWRVERGNGLYCSRPCKYRGNSGENHPNWKGGHEKYYGPSWNQQRRKALERDGHVCTMCGLDEAGHQDQYGQSLHVHHKTPFRMFGVENHEEANRLENLITVCQSCHHGLEPVSQERREP